MTIDDAAAILDVTEKYLKQLLREKQLRGSKRRLRGGQTGWEKVNGQDVRARRRRLRNSAR